MIVDSSALMAILLMEPECDEFIAHLSQARNCRISTVNWVETSMVTWRHLHAAGLELLDAQVKNFGIERVSVSLVQSDIARHAFLAYGRGQHPARLNFGDCFAYALAKETGEPLLFKGGDFALTDIAAVC